MNMTYLQYLELNLFFIGDSRGMNFIGIALGTLTNLHTLICKFMVGGP